MWGDGSAFASTTAQPRSAAVRRASAATSVETAPSTRVVPGRRTASFSAAISSSVSPSQAVWSRPIEVSTVTRDSRTLVASRRPPRPASITPTSTPASARATKAVAVAASNCVTRSPSAKPASTRGSDRGHPLGGVRERVRLDLAPADPDALRPARRMRREITTRCPSPGFDQRRGHRRDRRLPVRADHVHGLEVALRIAQGRQQRRDPLEPEPPADRVERPEPFLSVQAPPAPPGRPRASRVRPRPPRQAPWRRSPRSQACARRARPRSAAPSRAPRCGP